jgi:hypothetical protein
MQKIVINGCYGGFGVSTEATKKLRKRGNKYALKETLPGERYSGGELSTHDFNAYLNDIPRDDPQLVSLLREWGSKRVSGEYACLYIVEIPNDVEWEIDEYDGMESVEEKHRSWS